MLVLLFDVSSMQPEDIQRAVEESMKYVDESMANADLVAVVTIGSRLNVLTDFTSNREDADGCAPVAGLLRRHRG